MADYLHEAIIINILHRLPVKTLLRCTSVSKSWYSLITSPEFISSHSKFSSARKLKLLIRRCIRNSERYELYSDCKSFPRRATFEFPFTSMNSFFTIVGTCNGLLCLSDDRVYYMNTIILWNPCIRKSLLLPKPNLIYNSYGTFTQCLGFGFDSVANDYKVVRITYVDFARQPQIELYKLSTGVWLDLSYLGLDCVINNRSRQAYVNGASHWIARYMNFYDLIVSFDMCGEVFQTMGLPVSLVNDDQMRQKDLVVYRETLALISWIVSRPEPNFCVWVMQEYGADESWTKHFSFDFSSFGNGIMRPLWVRRNGEIIIVWQDGHLVSYDPDDGEVKDLGVVGSRSEEYRRSVHVDSYTSSLVLLEKGPYLSDAVNCSNLPSRHTNDCGNDGRCGSDHEDESENGCKCSHRRYEMMNLQLVP